jgi:hypothetical protein
MENRSLLLHVEHAREGTYFTLPFTMPPDTESLSVAYRYPRYRESGADNAAFTSRQEINVIDIGLIAPDGSQAGASGSDKRELFLSETAATPGYRPQPLVPGEWRILVGAYRVAAEGVTVEYTLSFTPKRRRLLKGDLHAHTIASDGVLTAEELGGRALRHGLDFLAVTDHNQMSSTDALPRIPGLTMIPGVEWTHYQGHAGFLGIDRPYDPPFFTNAPDEARGRFESARRRGALIIVNHPFEEGCGFQLDMNDLPFDCLEVWNGPMREANLRAIGLWQGLLAAGRRVPICGGSDYHRDTPFTFPGGPTTCLYSESPGTSDILTALKQGHAFVTFAPDGPLCAVSAGDAILGDAVAWPRTRELVITAENLFPGDVIRVVTAKASTPVCTAPARGRAQVTYSMDAPGFARVEILRAFLPGLPALPALLSNPIYFTEG